MSYSYVKVRVSNELSVNNYTRLLRDLQEMEGVDELEFWVD